MDSDDSTNGDFMDTFLEKLNDSTKKKNLSFKNPSKKVNLPKTADHFPFVMKSISGLIHSEIDIAHRIFQIIILKLTLQTSVIKLN